jgi:HEPN domain-containing protein
MNRKRLQALSEIRLREAQALFRAKHFSGTYYLAGYAVECALKACIAKQIKRYDFPDKKRVNDSYTHNLKELAGLSNLNQALLARSETDEAFQANWNLITLWSEKSRYETADGVKAKSLLDAIMESNSGVLPWIRQYW